MILIILNFIKIFKLLNFWFISKKSEMISNIDHLTVVDWQTFSRFTQLRLRLRRLTRLGDGSRLSSFSAGFRFCRWDCWFHVFKLFQWFRFVRKIYEESWRRSSIVFQSWCSDESNSRIMTLNSWSKSTKWECCEAFWWELISVLSRHQNRESLRIARLSKHYVSFFCIWLIINAVYLHECHLLNRWRNQSAKTNRHCSQKMNS
jgi:hypothetical protein